MAIAWCQVWATPFNTLPSEEVVLPTKEIDFNEDLKLGEKYSNNLVQKLNTSIKFKAVMQHDQLQAIHDLKVAAKKLPQRKLSMQT